ACLAGEEAVDALAHAEDLAGLDLDVGGAAAGAAPGLVQEEAGVREAEAVLARGCDVDERGGAGDPAAADHANGRLDEADDVVDGVAGLDVAAGRVDEHGDRLVGVGG